MFVLSLDQDQKILLTVTRGNSRRPNIQHPTSNSQHRSVFYRKPKPRPNAGEVSRKFDLSATAVATAEWFCLQRWQCLGFKRERRATIVLSFVDREYTTLNRENIDIDLFKVDQPRGHRCQMPLTQAMAISGITLTSLISYWYIPLSALLIQLLLFTVLVIFPPFFQEFFFKGPFKDFLSLKKSLFVKKK